MTKMFILQAAKLLGLLALMRIATRRSPRILCYHAGNTGDERHYNPKLFCTREQLRQRLDWLHKHGFTPTRLDQITQRGGPRTSGVPVAVTLDDGWYSSYRDLLPSLAEYGYEPVLYLHTEAYEAGTPIISVSVRYILWKAGARQVTLNGFPAVMNGNWNLANAQVRAQLCTAAVQWLSGEESGKVSQGLEHFAESLGISATELDLASRRFHYMSREELLDAAAHGCRIELHGHAHVYLRGQPQRNRENIELNRERIIAAGLPHAVHFCYPSGSFDEHAAKVMRAAGVESATTCIPGLVDVRDPDARYYLPRFLDGGNVSMLEFEAEMSGFTQLLRKFARQVQRPYQSLQPTIARVQSDDPSHIAPYEA